MTKEQATKMFESCFWEDLTLAQRARFQMNEPLLCMPFEVFHEAVEKTLGRPVFTHEFGLNWDGLKAELNGEIGPPTLTEIIGMLPREKVILLHLDGETP